MSRTESAHSNQPPSGAIADSSYHLQELKVALDRNDPNRILPDVTGAARILDIGCGAGQSLLALETSARCYGMDIDFAAVHTGHEHNERIQFLQAGGEDLPYRSGSFDFVFSRVAVPYMNVEKAVREMHRVLEPGGRVWLTLHPPRVPWAAWKRANLRGKVFFAYAIANGMLLHLTGKQIRFINGMCESYQTPSRMRKIMTAAGFKEIEMQLGKHFVVTGRA